MKIYTKKGDEGMTGLIGGTRVFKNDIRIESYGTIDELNSTIGLLSCQEMCQEDTAFLQEIQDRLFTLGSSLASDPEKNAMLLPDITEADLQLLEGDIDEMEKKLPKLTNFVLAGGHSANAIAHQARCICRRAERHCVALSRVAKVEPLILKYLNRLSDWLFVYSRLISFQAGVPEITWKPRTAGSK